MTKCAPTMYMYIHTCACNGIDCFIRMTISVQMVSLYCICTCMCLVFAQCLSAHLYLLSAFIYIYITGIHVQYICARLIQSFFSSDSRSFNSVHLLKRLEPSITET